MDLSSLIILATNRLLVLLWFFNLLRVIYFGFVTLTFDIENNNFLVGCVIISLNHSINPIIKKNDDLWCHM